MNIRKIIPFILLIAVACMALAACMNNGATNAQPTPTPTADYGPNPTAGATGATGATGMSGANNADGNTGATGNTAATTGDAMGPFDWLSGAANVEKTIGRISEVADARVVVTNTTALVGVKFDNAYKGEMTERIREMVAAEILKADPNIQTVAVTANADDVKKIYELSDQIRAGRTADDLSQDINAIVRNAATLR